MFLITLAHLWQMVDNESKKCDGATIHDRSSSYRRCVFQGQGGNMKVRYGDADVDDQLI